MKLKLKLKLKYGTKKWPPSGYGQVMIMRMLSRGFTFNTAIIAKYDDHYNINSTAAIAIIPAVTTTFCFYTCTTPIQL